MSAKGRGNLTNCSLQLSQDYVTDSPDFVHNAFQQYATKDFLHFLDEHYVTYQEEENGRILLQSRNARQFRDFLLQQLLQQGRIIKYAQDLQQVKKKADGTFEVQTASEVFTAKNVILATGSPSIPQI
jgi:predicted flavoprotein YhiN